MICMYVNCTLDYEYLVNLPLKLKLFHILRKCFIFLVCGCLLRPKFTSKMHAVTACNSFKINFNINYLDVCFIADREAKNRKKNYVSLDSRLS